MEIKGKIALVTGASRGIGRATAIALAKEGAQVIVNFKKNTDLAANVVAEIKQLGGDAIAYQADISKPEMVQSMADFIFEKFGRLDILVNNAGVIMRPGNWDQITLPDMDYTIDVDLKGMIYCIRTFVPKMIENQCGNIVNISSTTAFGGSPFVLAYTASKAGVITATKAMAKALGKYNIRVNTVAPGTIDTEMTTSAGDDYIKRQISITPLGRLGKPEEIAQGVVFLIEHEFVSGQVLTIDGGQSV